MMQPDGIRKLVEVARLDGQSCEALSAIAQVETAAQLAEMNQNFAAAIAIFREMQETSAALARHVVERDRAVLNPVPPPAAPAGGRTQ